MSIGEICCLIVGCILIALVVVLIILVLMKNKGTVIDYDKIGRANAETTSKEIIKFSEYIAANLKSEQDHNKEIIQKDLLAMVEQTKVFQDRVEKDLKNSAEELNRAVKELQKDNAEKLEQMRMTVDEKLQKTLEERINKSFETVQKHLNDVSEKVVEMRAVAASVNDLKGVITGVKTRGILGEVQLQSLLEEILVKEQYETNVKTKKGSSDPVEFAIKLPGTKDEPVYLPIDSKFPMENYNRLLESYNLNDKEEVKKWKSALERDIKESAKKISSKYIDVPNTTNFALMFLPSEGLYSEVIKLNLVEKLQREYHIVVTGPSTMAATLNALQMGFRTLIIQKKSSEVFRILQNVKKEFENFNAVLDKVKSNLEKTQSELETLAGTRSKKITNALKMIELPQSIEEEIVKVD